MSDRPTDDGKPESWQGNSPNGSNAGAGVALPLSFPPFVPSLPQTVRLSNRYRYRIPRQFCPKLGEGEGNHG